MNEDDNICNFLRPAVSVICATNRPNFIEQLLTNYQRQTYASRELIIILNCNSINLEEWKTKTAQHPDIRVYQLDERISLGECLNFAVEQANFDYIANFNDDDYYGSPYLEHAMAAFTYTDADLVGKGSMYVYFKASRQLANMWPDREHCYVQAVAGATLVFKKKVFAKVRFPDRNTGEDYQFNTECFQKGYRIYATDRFNYVCIRYDNPDHHTWKVKDDILMKCCIFVSHTEDYATPTTLLGPFSPPNFYLCRANTKR